MGLSDANISKLKLCRIIREVIPEFIDIEAPVGRDPDRGNPIVYKEKL